MPLVLGPDEVQAFSDADAPPPMLDLLAAVGFRACAAALRLGVFQALDLGRRTVPELAAALDLDPDGLRQLLAVLADGGYLDVHGDTVANSAVATRWLLDDQFSFRGAVLLWADLLRLWDTLEASVRTGSPAEDFYGWLAADPRAAAGFQQLLAGTARWVSPELVELVALPAGTGRLLDVGGGHGQYAVAFCQQYPGLRATVLDLPAALPAARKTVAEAGLGDRVELVAGDWTQGALGEGYDVVLLLNLLHGNTAEGNAALLSRAAAALRPGGLVAVLDQLAGDPGAPPEADAASDRAFVNAFSLNLFHTQGGRVHRRSDIDGWLAAAGFGDVTWRGLRRMSDNHLATAVRAVP